MSDIITNYIKIGQYKRFGHQVVLKNETSGTTLQQTELIVIKELKDKGIVLEVPNGQCQKGHTLTLYFFNQDYKFKPQLFSSLIKEAHAEIIGKVETLFDHLESKTTTIEITFVQYNVKKWKETIESCNKNQDEINNLLSKQHLSRSDDE